MMIYKDTVSHDCMMTFNIPEKSGDAFMKVQLFRVDMEKEFPNIERIVRAKGMKVGKCRASSKISTYKLRTYKVHSY